MTCICVAEMGKCLSKQVEEEVEPRKLHERELQLLLDTTSYNRAEIDKWHGEFVVGPSFLLLYLLSHFQLTPPKE